MIMDTRTLVKQIAKFYKNYEDEFLKERIENKDSYLSTPKDALFFILSYSFYQGRRDELSERFRESAEKALEEFFKETDPFSSSFERIHKKGLKSTEYEKELKQGDSRLLRLLDILEVNKVNKRGDRLMVASLINFIESNKEKNLVKMIIQEIESKNISEAYKKLDSIWSIGSKIASLTLRDVVYIYELEDYLDKESYYYLQPIDTWVHKLSKELRLIDKDKIYRDEARDITNKCFELGINPIHYNQGAWYIGSNSLQILLKNIDRIIQK